MLKKMFWGLAATALFFSNCSKDRETSVNTGTDPKAIGLAVSTGIVRASDNTILTLQNSSVGFGVVAKTAGGTKTHINNELHKFVASEWEWADPTGHDWKLWPTAETDYPMDFYGYYPAPSGFSLDASSLEKEYIIQGEASQVDYLAASKRNILMRPASGKVSLDFKHITSKIRFNILCDQNADVFVQSIAIRNVGDTRSFKYASFEWGNEPATFASSYEYLTLQRPAIVYADSIKGSNGPLMLMPQDLALRTPWDPSSANAAPTGESYIEVVYRVKNGSDDMVGYSDADDYPGGSGSTIANPHSPLFVKVAYPLPTKWELCKAYTYILYLGHAGGSGGNLIEDNFVDENGNDSGLPVVHPDDPKVPIKVPDQIVDLKKPIGFNVIVSDWIAPNDVPLQ
ncbi:MAG: fimbrillin family protein [Prevotellaceae bacterium]|nr:fimbrillin family protein [Prevotellaceae bacterium]